MRLILPLAVVAGALGLTAPVPQSDCGDPHITIEGSPDSGGTVVIEGGGFSVGCDEGGSGGSAGSGSEADSGAEAGSDSGSGFEAGSDPEGGSETGSVAAGGCSVEGTSTGSGSSTEDGGSGQPAQNVRVTIIQDGDTFLLGVRDGDESAEIRLETELPEELHEGIATLHAESEGGEDAEATITIGESQ